MAFKVDSYLDRSYDSRRSHCWHLVSDAWLDLTGDDLRKGTVRRQLQQLAEPRNPCVILMVRRGTVPHAGLFRNGRVLHIRREGVKYERVDDATRGYSEVRYYAKRHADPGPAGSA